MVNVMIKITKSYKETIDLGERIASFLNTGDILLLKGDLAGGKTTFTKGIGKGLGVKTIINSPTFTILKSYDGKDIKLHHIDAYRLAESDYDLGFDELEEDGVMVIEWPEYYKPLPKKYLELDFKYIDDDTREITIIPHGDHYKKIIEEI